MDLASADWLALVITGFATLFIIGEMLVNARGLFAVTGIALISFYFYFYLETGSFIMMFIIYATGLLLIIIDGKFLNDGTLAVLGLVAMLTAVALAAPNMNTGIYAAAGVLLGGGASFLLLKFFRKRNMWNKIALKDRLTSEAGYNSMNADYAALVDEEALTLNDLRPVGTIRIGDKKYSAVSNGEWIPKDSIVRVVQVDGTKILVQRIEIGKQ